MRPFQKLMLQETDRVLLLKGQLSQLNVRLCNTAGSNMKARCCQVLYGPASSPLPQPCAHSSTLTLSQFTEKNTPRKIKSILLCWSISLPTMWVVTSTSTKTGQHGLWLKMDGWWGTRTAPLELSDQPRHISEPNPYKKDSQKRIPSEPRNQPVSARWSKERALKAAMYLPDTSKSARACCESPVRHAWGQLSTE